MSKIVQLDCFKNGFHRLVVDCYGADHLQSYIDRYEEYYLCKLLGKDLAEQLCNDLVDGVPQSEDILKWFEPFCEEIVSECGCDTRIYHSKGIKDMLTGFIYYEYVRQNQVQQTNLGIATPETTNSTMIDFIDVERYAEMRYNDAAITYEAVAIKLDISPFAIDVKFLDLI